MNDIIYAGKHALTFNVSRHAHASMEFIYCTSGEGLLVFDDRELSYHAGDIAVIPPMLPHSNLSKNGFTNIHINLSDCSLNIQEPLVISSEENHSMEGVFQSAFVFYSSDPAPCTSLLEAFGNLFVAYAELTRPARIKTEIVQQIEYNIIHNYADSGYDLAAYLHSLSFSYDYLIKMFKKELGVTPHKYLTDLRLRSAANLLRNSQGNNVSEIAHICGFKEPLYFSRLFKKKYEVSPSFYASGRPALIKSGSDQVKIPMGNGESDPAALN